MSPGDLAAAAIELLKKSGDGLSSFCLAAKLDTTVQAIDTTLEAATAYVMRTRERKRLDADSWVSCWHYRLRDGAKVPPTAIAEVSALQSPLGAGVSAEEKTAVLGAAPTSSACGLIQMPSPDAEGLGFMCALSTEGDMLIESNGTRLVLPVEHTRRMLRYLDKLAYDELLAEVEAV